MTPMVAECGYNKGSSYLIDWLFGNNHQWDEYNKANCLNSNINFHKEIMILTSPTVDKWSHRYHFAMSATENSFSSKLEIP